MQCIKQERILEINMYRPHISGERKEAQRAVMTPEVTGKVTYLGLEPRPSLPGAGLSLLPHDTSEVSDSGCPI